MNPDLEQENTEGLTMKKEPVMKILEIMKLDQTIKILKKFPTTCLGFRTIPTCEDALAIGTSKVGGNPELPSLIEWPVSRDNYLDCLLQLNFAEIPHNLRNELLPESGWLYFFYDRKRNAWGFDPRDEGSWRVLSFDGTED
jgi:uncharacterized protein YwqG